MSRHTTFHIGGNAGLFIQVGDENSLSRLVRYLYENSMEYFILGNGSNLLVSDRGIDIPVIRLCGEFEKVTLSGETCVTAYAAANLSSVCRFALSQSLSGLEFAYGIPGSLGGAVYMNAGAYGGQMSDAVKKVTYMTKSGEIKSCKEEQLCFGYRESVFKDKDDIILSADISLEKGDEKLIGDKMNDLMQRRKDKQPLSMPNAGSVFKRPQGYFAGALIEQSGLKGAKIGGAQVSEKHAGFIVNTGDATCSDVLSLIAHCQKTVKDKFSVELEREIKLI